MSKEKKGISSEELRQCLKEVLAKEVAQLPVLMGQLSPEERVKTIVKILPFFVPQTEKVQSSLDNGVWGVD